MTQNPKVNLMPTAFQAAVNSDPRRLLAAQVQLRVVQVQETKTIVTRNHRKTSADRRSNTLGGREVEVQVGIMRVVTRVPVRGTTVVKLFQTFPRPQKSIFRVVLFTIKFYSSITRSL